LIEQQTARVAPSTASEDVAASAKVAASRAPYRVLLVSTYDLGRQPFGLASPAAWLSRTGVSVKCLDLSREPFRETVFEHVDFVGVYLPMHTATEHLRSANDRIHVKQLPENRPPPPSRTIFNLIIDYRILVKI